MADKNEREAATQDPIADAINNLAGAIYAMADAYANAHAEPEDQEETPPTDLAGEPIKTASL